MLDACKNIYLPTFFSIFLFLLTDDSGLARDAVILILDGIIAGATWLRDWLVNSRTRTTGDPHISFGDIEQPGYDICYNMGGEDGVRYDLYTHGPTCKRPRTIELLCVNKL